MRLSGDGEEKRGTDTQVRLQTHKNTWIQAARMPELSDLFKYITDKLIKQVSLIKNTYKYGAWKAVEINRK